MEELTHDAKIAVLRILNDIVNADNIVKDIEVEKGDRLIVTGGIINGQSGNTNLIKIETI